MTPEQQRLLEAMMEAGNRLGPIDYTREPQRQPYGGRVGESASPMPGRLERLIQAMGGMGTEMTGVPAAARAGEALAQGDVQRGIGEGLMALPSRLTAVPGMILSSAEAQQPDPRQKQIDKLDEDIAKREKTIKDYGGRKFPSTAARTAATKVEQDAIADARATRKRLVDAMLGEAEETRNRQLAEERGAAWRNTPTAKAYPGVQYGTAIGGGLLSAMLGFRGARQPVVQFNEQVRSIVERQRAAIDKANDKTLSAAERNQARRTAEAAQSDYDAAVAAQPRLTLGDRGTAFLTSGASTDLGMMLPTLGDYVYSFQDPQGSLHSESLHQLNPLENPGRYGAGFGAGGFAGLVGQELGERFPGVRVPPSYAAETAGLPSRYQSPRKPSTRKRK